LLFVLALLLIVRGWRRLLATVTAFTLAHSITLAAATLGWVSVTSRWRRRAESPQMGRFWAVVAHAGDVSIW
ncbi:MAG: HupE/UreJ family protein, partial [Polyangiales bacterium]